MEDGKLIKHTLQTGRETGDLVHEGMDSSSGTAGIRAPPPWLPSLAGTEEQVFAEIQTSSELNFLLEALVSPPSLEGVREA